MLAAVQVAVLNNSMVFLESGVWRSGVVERGRQVSRCLYGTFAIRLLAFDILFR